MTVQQRIMNSDEANQGFGLLKDIVDMVKNPKAIDDAYERRRKAAELTDDEVAKSEEARALIAQADELKKSLQESAESILAEKSMHETNISNFNSKVQSENSRLKEWEDKLNTIAIEQEENAQKHLQAREDLLAESKKNKDSQNEREEKINFRENQVKEVEFANTKEAERISTWEQKLREKAARLAAEAAS